MSARFAASTSGLRACRAARRGAGACHLVGSTRMGRRPAARRLRAFCSMAGADLTLKRREAESFGGDPPTTLCSMSSSPAHGVGIWNCSSMRCDGTWSRWPPPDCMRSRPNPASCTALIRSTASSVSVNAGRRHRLSISARPARHDRPSVLHHDRPRRLPARTRYNRTTSAVVSSPRSTRWATDFTNRASLPSSAARRWATPSRWRFTSRRPGCGRTSSAGACLSGTLLPLARRAFPAALDDVWLDDFHFAVNHVEPTLIRVEADEVTYNLHILIRFELERPLSRAIFRQPTCRPRGTSVSPTSRHRRRPTMRTAVCRMATGRGPIGYFPTYTLGNLCGPTLRKRGRGLRRFERRSSTAISLRCWIGCATTSIAMPAVIPASPHRAGDGRTARLSPAGSASSAEVWRTYAL